MQKKSFCSISAILDPLKKQILKKNIIIIIRMPKLSPVRPEPFFVS